MTHLLNLTVCLSPAPRQVLEFSLQVPEGSTVKTVMEMASALSSWPADLPDSVWKQWTAGVWCHKCEWTQAVRDGDRIELYRPLLVDPKVARRKRFKGQGAKRAGLFAKRRPGAAAGY
jgi:putative ubiquitin-RnfH superfamily antitoxin RatB of RatAB toxin-antitoxin module